MKRKNEDRAKAAGITRMVSEQTQLIVHQIAAVHGVWPIVVAMDMLATIISGLGQIDVEATRRMLRASADGLGSGNNDISEEFSEAGNALIASYSAHMLRTEGNA